MWKVTNLTGGAIKNQPLKPVLGRSRDLVVGSTRKRGRKTDCKGTDLKSNGNREMQDFCKGAGLVNRLGQLLLRFENRAGKV